MVQLDQAPAVIVRFFDSNSFLRQFRIISGGRQLISDYPSWMPPLHGVWDAATSKMSWHSKHPNGSSLSAPEDFSVAGQVTCEAELRDATGGLLVRSKEVWTEVNQEEEADLP